MQNNNFKNIETLVLKSNSEIFEFVYNMYIKSRANGTSVNKTKQNIRTFFLNTLKEEKSCVIKNKLSVVETALNYSFWKISYSNKLYYNKVEAILEVFIKFKNILKGSKFYDKIIDFNIFFKLNINIPKKAFNLAIDDFLNKNKSIEEKEIENILKEEAKTKFEVSDGIVEFSSMINTLHSMQQTQLKALISQTALVLKKGDKHQK